MSDIKQLGEENDVLSKIKSLITEILKIEQKLSEKIDELKSMKEEFDGYLEQADALSNKLEIFNLYFEK